MAMGDGTRKLPVKAGVRKAIVKEAGQRLPSTWRNQSALEGCLPPSR
jgi:hypothetical protein